MKKTMYMVAFALMGCTARTMTDEGAAFSNDGEGRENIAACEKWIVDMKFYTKMEELLSLPETFNYDFILLSKDHPMRILTPSDHRFRIYSMYSSGSARCATNYLQYFDREGRLHVRNLDPWDGPGVAFGPELNEIVEIAEGYVLVGYTRMDSSDEGGITRDTLRYEDFEGGL